MNWWQEQQHAWANDWGKVIKVARGLLGVGRSIGDEYISVRAAYQSYGRKRSLRGFAMSVITVALIYVPFALQFQTTNSMMWLLGVGILWHFHQTELRLKTMQIRLAQMHDLLERIAGTDEGQNNQHAIGELNDW